MSTAGGIRVGRSSAEEFDARLVAARLAAPAYDHVGSTLHPQRWPGRSPRSARRTLPRADDDPSGHNAFARAVDGLRAWVPQRYLGARIHPRDAVVKGGETLLVVLAFGPFEVTAPNRVVDVIDEVDRFGFAYGTLPGHPALGEEAFLIERSEGGDLHLHVTVDSVPATLAGRALAPLVTQAQRQAVRRYLRELARYVQRG